MPYFFIIPAFAVLELLLIAALVGSFVHGGLRPYRPHVVYVVVWSTFGFTLANGVLWGTTFVILRLSDPARPASQLIKASVIMLMFAGPFVASLAGVSLGAIAGLRHALQHERGGGRTRG